MMTTARTGPRATTATPATTSDRAEKPPIATITPASGAATAAATPIATSPIPSTDVRSDASTERTISVLPPTTPKFQPTPRITSTSTVDAPRGSAIAPPTPATSTKTHPDGGDGARADAVGEPAADGRGREHPRDVQRDGGTDHLEIVAVRHQVDRRDRHDPDHHEVRDCEHGHAVARRDRRGAVEQPAPCRSGHGVDAPQERHAAAPDAMPSASAAVRNATPAIT